MSESAISAKSAKQIFANFVKFIKSIFGTTRRSEGSVTEAEYPTNNQRISNLLLTIRPFRVAILAVLLVFVGGWNTQAWAQLPYNTTLTSSHYNNSKIVVSKEGNVSCSNGEITMYKTGYIFPIGTGDWGSWDEKYVIIALDQTGIPYQLKFKFKCSSNIATNPDWYVAESTSKNGPWTNVWSTKSNATTTSNEL